MTNQQLFTEIINRAERGEHLPTSKIRNLSNYVYARKARHIIDDIIDNLTHGVNSTVDTHCREIVAGTATATKLLVARTLLDTLAFYKTEQTTLNETICDYEDYLLRGNILFALLGEQRKD